ncbi:MAG: internalization-related competence protein ComEC/Rec2 protein [Candidatus Woesebacteria bacterium GW2011_GWB1_45_5]|uniref:Internalization-related competence protein ComEC/Rec2 protein n=1 Tax=Candidatus Woesebacteria bacterium GW2011_GWB1_45_5 TaxID=1618581 RepID=A0A0G1MQR5_9BACT|nr:MAG: internalization-related competence protein ComEC/Rec2 protein [Candidatus Woesebacteria bacterium GW2011_GWB1_45_5]
MVVRFSHYIFLLLILSAMGIWIAVLQFPDKNLHLVTCDVGQGDASLAIYGNIQILTDGGPDNKVLDCLGRHVPFWDREIELVVLTHPEKDHYGGLIEVFRRYKIDNFLYNKIDIGSQGYKVLEKEMGSRAVNPITPDTGKVVKVGLMSLDILHPSRDLESKQTNDYSIVYKLSYGNFEALFAGDIEQRISDRLAGERQIGQVEYIKIPHHGSKNGVTDNLLKVLMPKIAVISAGKNNSYGHPHKEILEMLGKYGVKIFRTDEAGDIEIITDGEKYWVKK